MLRQSKQSRKKYALKQGAQQCDAQVLVDSEIRAGKLTHWVKISKSSYERNDGARLEADPGNSRPWTACGPNPTNAPLNIYMVGRGSTIPRRWRLLSDAILSLDREHPIEGAASLNPKAEACAPPIPNVDLSHLLQPKPEVRPQEAVTERFSPAA